MARRPIPNLVESPKWERTPAGHINNCAVANGYPEDECQICEGSCPDRKVIPHPTADRSAVEVRMVPIPEAAQLATVGPQAALWTSEKVSVGLGDYQGSFVRVQPPHGADDGRIEAIRLAFKLAGAEAVVVAPRTKGPGIILPATADRSAVGRIGASSRDVVLQMASEANTQDRAALVTLLEELMGKAGL